ncbi:MAG TPA: zf-TFIIB domain-containing protein [Actinomycetes bacterium]
MQCPVCDVRLAVTDRQGVEIDHCPRCRGVWLDRGELDKLIERAAGDRPFRDRQHDDDEDSLLGGGGLGRGRDGAGGRRRRRRGFLDDLFDFG